MGDPALPYLAAGFGAVWVILGAYLLYLARTQRRLTERLDEITDRPRPADDQPQA